MDAWAIVLAVLLSAWFALSAVAQMSVRWPRLTTLWRWDAQGLLPRYHFFCPTPVQHDYHLLARACDETGAVGSWREVVGPPPRHLWNAVWNPDRRAYKCLCDLMEAGASAPLRGHHRPGRAVARLGAGYRVTSRAGVCHIRREAPH